MKKNIIITEQQTDALVQNLINLILGKNYDLKNLLNISKSSSGISKDFEKIIDMIIDNFEGGYYDPMTMKSSAMGNSGETMYGMDAKASDMLKTSDGRQFWDLIHDDKRKNPGCWKYNYDPAKATGNCSNPTLAKELKNLISKMMKPQYDQLSNKYLSSEARKIVNNTPELLFNFTYAVWNGAGYFKKFSEVLNQTIDAGIKDPNKLAKIMVDYRKNFSEYSSFANRLTQRGGKSMEKVLGMA